MSHCACHINPPCDYCEGMTECPECYDLINIEYGEACECEFAGADEEPGSDMPKDPPT